MLGAATLPIYACICTSPCPWFCMQLRSGLGCDVIPLRLLIVLAAEVTRVDVAAVLFVVPACPTGRHHTCAIAAAAGQTSIIMLQAHAQARCRRNAESSHRWSNTLLQLNGRLKHIPEFSTVPVFSSAHMRAHQWHQTAPVAVTVLLIVFIHFGYGIISVCACLGLHLPVLLDGWPTALQLAFALLQRRAQHACAELLCAEPLVKQLKWVVVISRERGTECWVGTGGQGLAWLPLRPMRDIWPLAGDGLA